MVPATTATNVKQPQKAVPPPLWTTSPPGNSTSAQPCRTRTASLRGPLTKLLMSYYFLAIRSFWVGAIGWAYDRTASASQRELTTWRQCLRRYCAAQINESIGTTDGTAGNLD